MKLSKFGLMPALACVTFAAAHAEIPDGFYNTLNGKSGRELEAAIKNLADGHTRVTYNTKAWDAFELTDVRTVNGRQVWWDMYSNDIVYLPDHDALNREHSVANSWWGGSKGNADAYADLFHLNPSSQDANNSKGNNPPGTVADARLFDNGLFKVGTPSEGQGGGATSVFEPADEYKGDFARAYFYIFTAYAGIDWIDDDTHAYVYDSEGRLKQWAVDLLLQWHRDDPVDSKEINRNEEIYKLQKNRNPFIDFPGLVEYVWGKDAGTAFFSEKEPATVASDRPAAPVFPEAWMTGVDTYALRWWDGMTLEVKYDEDPDLKLYVSVDGDSFNESDGTIFLDPANANGETHTFRAYVVRSDDSMLLRSPVATLTVASRDPSATDWSAGRWERVSGAMDWTAVGDSHYILLSSNTLHVMKADGGTSTRQFMPSAGFVRMDNSDRVVELPTDAAIISFENVGVGKTRLMVTDIFGNYKGSWNATAKNKMRLDAETYTPGQGSINSDDTFSFTFDQYGSLQFNKSQPRFLNYETSQCPVYLYRFVDFGDPSGAASVPESAPWSVGIGGDTIILPEGTVIYDLGGRRVSPRNLGHGVYIVAGQGHSQKIVL